MVNNTVREATSLALGTVDAGLSLQETAHLMRTWDIREVVVVQDGRPIGVLTDREIVILAIASGHDPNVLTAGECVAATSTWTA